MVDRSVGRREDDQLRVTTIRVLWTMLGVVCALLLSIIIWLANKSLDNQNEMQKELAEIKLEQRDLSKDVQSLTRDVAEIRGTQVIPQKLPRAPAKVPQKTGGGWVWDLPLLPIRPEKPVSPSHFWMVLR